jgi:hypothetical protein
MIQAYLCFSFLPLSRGSKRGIGSAIRLVIKGMGIALSMMRRSLTTNATRIHAQLEIFYFVVFATLFFFFEKKTVIERRKKKDACSKTKTKRSWRLCTFIYLHIIYINR